MRDFFSPVLAPFRLVVLRVQNGYDTSHLKKEIDLTNQPKWKIESEPLFVKAFVEKHPRLKYYGWISYIGMVSSYLFKNYLLKSSEGKIILLTLVILFSPGIFMVILYYTIRILYRFSQWKKIFVWNPGIHTVAAVWNSGKILVKNFVDSWPVVGGVATSGLAASAVDEKIFKSTGERPLGVRTKITKVYGLINPERAQEIEDALVGGELKKKRELGLLRQEGE